MTQIKMTVKREQIYSICYGLLVGGYTTLFHEFWRDETQAFQMARHSKSLGQLLALGRYEGHPPLLYFIYFFTSRIFPIPLALSVIGGIGAVLLCYGTYRFLRMYFDDKRSFAFTILLSLTVFYCYEFGVIVRGYGMGVGLVLWAIALANERKKFRLSLALFCFASLLSIHTALFAATGFLVFAMPHIRRRPWLSVLFFSVFSFSLLYCIYPNPDRPYLQIGQVLRSVPVRTEFWNRLDTFFQELVFPRSWWFLSFQSRWEYPARVVLALFIVFAAFFWIRERVTLTRAQKPLLIWVFFNSLLFIGGLWLVHFGGYRHRLHFYLPIWLAIAVISMQSVRGKYKYHQRVGQAFLIFWVSLQVLANAYCLSKDYRFQFSPTYSLTQVIPKDAKILVETDWVVTSIPFWRDDIEIRPLNAAGRKFKYAKWDYARSHRVDWHTLFTTVCLEKPNQMLPTLTDALYPSFQFWCTYPPVMHVTSHQYSDGVKEAQYYHMCSCDRFFDYMRNPVKFHQELNERLLKDELAKRDRQR